MGMIPTFRTRAIHVVARVEVESTIVGFDLLKNLVLCQT
jgi:hypothetical protein